MFDKRNITLVLYHASCIDGISSSAIVKYFYDLNSLSLPKFVSCRYNEKINLNFHDENVLVVDFSFDEETTNRIISETGGNFLNIDHHEGSNRSLTNIETKYKLFDNNHCGAVLTWKYFFAEKPVPEILNYIEDYDLWKLSSQRKWKEMNLVISQMLADENKKIDFMCDFITEIYNSSKKLAKLIKRGEIIKEYTETLIVRQLNSVMLVCIKDPLGIKDHIVLALSNSSSLTNELSDKVLELTPQIDGIITYRILPELERNKIIASMRTRNYPAHLFTAQYGGGGHPQAAGFTFYNNFPFKILFITYYNNFIRERTEYLTGIEYDILKSYFPDKIKRGIFLRLTKEKYEPGVIKDGFRYENESLQLGDTVLCYVDSNSYHEYVVIEKQNSLAICSPR